MKDRTQAAKEFEHKGKKKEAWRCEYWQNQYQNNSYSGSFYGLKRGFYAYFFS
jgi:hypothetical protein